jgi:hypothetical protein
MLLKHIELLLSRILQRMVSRMTSSASASTVLPQCVCGEYLATVLKTYFEGLRGPGRNIYEPISTNSVRVHTCD